MASILLAKAPDLYELWLQLTVSQDRTLAARDIKILTQVLEDGYTPVQVALGMVRWLNAEQPKNLWVWHRSWEQYTEQDALRAGIELVLELGLVERPSPAAYDYIDWCDGAWGAVPDDTNGLAKIRDDVRVWCDATLGGIHTGGGAGTAQRSHQDERQPSNIAQLRAARRRLYHM
jgi:hypothetical protein